MSFRITNIHDYERFIAVDLGSYRVRASLYVIKDGKLQLERNASIRQQRKHMPDGSIGDMQGVATTIDKAIHEACGGIDTIPDDIIIGFSPEICIHDALISQYIREDGDIPLDMEEIDMMIVKIEKSSLIRAKIKAKKEYAIVHDDIRLISSTLTSIMIDGKQVANPIGSRGKYVRINILNVFALASEYNMLRSIVASLKKNTISIVPIPLVFSKIIEKGEYLHEDSISIDIGYTHVTIVFQKKNEITFFDTFSIGSNMLMDMMTRIYPELSYTQIENLLLRMSVSDAGSLERNSLTQEYFTYVIDTLLSIIIRENTTIASKNIFLSGGVLSSEWMKNIFLDMLSALTGHEKNHLYLADIPLAKKIPTEYLVTSGLALLGQELLYTKKDPIVRILRYTLYNYE